MKTSPLQKLALLGLLAYASSAIAQDDYATFNDPFRVYLGGFWPKMDSQLSINGDTLPPVPPIDVEDALRIEDNTFTGWGGISWHFAPRHSIQLEYFALNRDGGVSGTYSPPIQVEDFFIEAGAIDTFYDTSVGRLTYGFSLVRSERTDFQLKAGIHVAELGAGLTLAGQICSPNTVPTSPPGCPVAQTGTASEDVTAPLPHLGIAYAYAMTPSLSVNLEALAFAVELDSIDGSIIELDADIAWQPWRNIGFGAGFRYFNINVKAGNSTLNGEFDFEYLGPTVYVHATF